VDYRIYSPRHLFFLLFFLQILFRSMRHPDSRCPLFKVFQANFPILAKYIKSVRSRFGPSGLAHKLTKLEGEVMGPAARRMASLCPTLRIHDGLCIPNSRIDQAIDILKNSGAEHFGFPLLVSAK
jgi:hypothetical protein